MKRAYLLKKKLKGPLKHQTYVLFLFVSCSEMESAQTSSAHKIPQVIVGAIGVGIVGVIVVAMVIYLCCFKQKLNPNQRRGDPKSRKNKGIPLRSISVQKKKITRHLFFWTEVVLTQPFFSLCEKS